jgi:hypothetical protein
MSREAYLWWSNGQAAGRVQDWPALARWVRAAQAIRPRSPLALFIEADRPAQASDLEADLIACFAAHDRYPPSALEFLTAVLNRPVSGAESWVLSLEPPGDDDETGDEMIFDPPALIERLADVTEAEWPRVKRRAVLLLVIEKCLTAEPSTRDERDARDSELAAALQMLRG